MTNEEKVVLGRWRINSMEMWDADYFDMEVPAHITIHGDLMGEFQFGLVQGGLGAQVSVTGGVARVDFSWEGCDENDPASGRGWMKVKGDQAEGRFFFHQGDDSGFTAVLQNNR